MHFLLYVPAALLFLSSNMRSISRSAYHYMHMQQYTRKYGSMQSDICASYAAGYVFFKYSSIMNNSCTPSHAPCILGTATTTAAATIETVTSSPHTSPLATSSVLPSSPSPLLPIPTSTPLLSSPTVGGSLTVTTPQRQPATPGNCCRNHPRNHVYF